MRNSNRFRRIAFTVGPFFFLAFSLAIGRYALRTTPAPEPTDAESVELKKTRRYLGG